MISLDSISRNEVLVHSPEMGRREIFHVLHQILRDGPGSVMERQMLKQCRVIIKL